MNLGIRGQVTFQKTTKTGEITKVKGSNLVVTQGYVWFLWGLSCWPHWRHPSDIDENRFWLYPEDMGAIDNVRFGASGALVAEDQTNLQGGELFSFLNSSLFPGTPAKSLIITKILGTDGWGIDVDLVLGNYTGSTLTVRECGIFSSKSSVTYLLARFLLGDQTVSNGDDLALNWKLRLELHNG